ncbi:MAG: PAS domain S-box protein [Candidatus Omnitrophica bacterium]|nr:PAS domain S-box protein [Candidatus Omnitrophota bacterium]
MTQKKRPSLRKSRSRTSLKTSAKPKTSSKKLFVQSQKVGLPVPKGELNFFRYMVDQIGDEVLVSDDRARIVFVNDATAKGLGYAKKNILGRPVTDFFKEKITVRQWRRMYFEEIKRKKKPASYIVNRVIKGKKVRTIQITAVYMAYRSKGYVLTVGRDITEQLAVHAKLKTSEDRYRLLSEQAAEGILMVNLKGIILYANRAVANIFKVSPGKAIGTHLESYMDKASVPKARECFKKVMSGVPSMCSDLNIKDKNGKIIPSEFMSSPVFIGKKVAQAHVIFRDMRQRKEMESLLRESEKMKALQNFVAGTTREIQQPLKGLMDRSQSLIDKYKDRHFEYIGYKEFNDIMKTLQTMNDQMRYCYDTTDRIVSLNRRRAKLEERHCSVNSVIRESVGMLKHSLEVSDITLKLRLSSRLPHVAIGPLDMGQVIDNVLTNAIQALPSGGGKIQITTKYQKALNFVRIDYRDDGVGIPKEVLDHVFEPFFTTKPRGLEKSSGLGLSIVYSIVKTHQGEITIKSDFRKGTFVTVLLPAHRVRKRSRSQK